MRPILALQQRDLLAFGVVILLLLFGAFMVATATAERRRRAKIPWAMRPGPGDDELERRLIARYYAWGGIATMFMAVFLPALLIREPARIKLEEGRVLNVSVRRGGEIYGAVGLTAVNCARCHGRVGEGLAQPVITVAGNEGKPVTMAEPPLQYIFARYKAAGRNDEEIRQLVRDAVERGRPGTPMPTWALTFGGPLNAQQVDDVVNFILAPAPEGGYGEDGKPGENGHGLQVDAPKSTTADGAELFARNCAICHGPNGSGRTDDGLRTIAPNLQIELQRNTVEQIHDIISEGRLNTNRFSMPAWAYLGKNAVDALVVFIQSIQGGGA